MVNELNMTFRKLILFSALTVLLGVGVVYALSYAFTPQNSSQTLPTTQGVYDGFQLTMTLQKTNYTLGEPTNITLTITNISNQTNTIYVSAYNDFDFQVYNGTNSIIYQYSDFWIGQVHPDVIYNETLRAGESLSQNFVWTQTYPVPIGGSEGVPVSSGTYYIVGLIGSVLSGKSMIETTPIQITIV